MCMYHITNLQNTWSKNWWNWKEKQKNSQLYLETSKFSAINRTSKQKYQLRAWKIWTILSTNLTFRVHSVPGEQNTHSFQVHVEHSLRQIFWVIKQVSNLRELIWNMFYDHSGIKLEINYGEISGKFSNTWKLSTHLNNSWIKEEN